MNYRVFLSIREAIESGTQSSKGKNLHGCLQGKQTKAEKWKINFFQRIRNLRTNLSNSSTATLGFVGFPGVNSKIT